MENKNGLSITWKNKEKILVEFDGEEPVWLDKIEELPEKKLKKHFSYGVQDGEDRENMLIKGNNIYSLKLLEKEFSGKIKCIYIDPPFNTGKVFDHYADGMENTLWLSMMKCRLEIMRNLLSEDGAIFVHIDDDEMPYLKLLMDEVFGSNPPSYVATIIWQKKFSPQNDAKFFSDVHDFILVYAKDIKKLQLNLIERTKEQNSRYTNRDNDPRGPWMSSDLTVKTPNPEWVYGITLPSGRIVKPSKSRSWGFSQKRFEELVAENRIWFGEKGDSMPRLKRFLSDVKNGVVPKTIWTREEVGDNGEGKKEVKKFVSENYKVFTTPKPERLLQRVLHIATNEGDWVLDAFLGSGTTCAAAHKMGRKWIGLESGQQMEEICIPRLKAVIDGRDDGGITQTVQWEQGGGFTYYSVE
jgi:adenine-specific DNA-methyltransferase